MVDIPCPHLFKTKESLNQDNLPFHPGFDLRQPTWIREAFFLWTHQQPFW